MAAKIFPSFNVAFVLFGNGWVNPNPVPVPARPVSKETNPLDPITTSL